MDAPACLTHDNRHFNLCAAHDVPATSPIHVCFVTSRSRILLHHLAALLDWMYNAHYYYSAHHQNHRHARSADRHKSAQQCVMCTCRSAAVATLVDLLHVHVCRYCTCASRSAGGAGTHVVCVHRQICFCHCCSLQTPSVCQICRCMPCTSTRVCARSITCVNK
jgi:hypothetical protein